MNDYSSYMQYNKGMLNCLFELSSLQVGNLFVTHRSTIITVYNGAFDSSSVIFLIIKVIITNKHTHTYRPMQRFYQLFMQPMKPCITISEGAL